jgi:hypothetical protein
MLLPPIENKPTLLIKQEIEPLKPTKLMAPSNSNLFVRRDRARFITKID